MYVNFSVKTDYTYTIPELSLTGELCVGVIDFHIGGYLFIRPVVYVDKLYYQKDSWQFTTEQQKRIDDLTEKLRKRVTEATQEKKYDYIINEVLRRSKL